VSHWLCDGLPVYPSSAREGGREPAGGQKIVFGNLCCWYCNNIIVCGFFD